MSDSDTAIKQALQAALPPELHVHIAHLAALLAALTADGTPQGAEPMTTATTAALLGHLAGKELATERAVLNFGQQSQLGDVTIRDVAGNNVIKHNLFVLVGSPAPAGTPAPPSPSYGVAGAPSGATVDRVRLRQLIETAFNMGEIDDLCFQLAIDHEQLPGTTRSVRARELVLYCERYGRVGELVALCRRLRPHLAAELPEGAA